MPGFTEMFEDLAVAILGGDILKAQSELRVMDLCGHKSECIDRARRTVRPLRSAPPLTEPIQLPQPGADPHQVFGGQRQFSGAHGRAHSKARKRA